MNRKSIRPVVAAVLLAMLVGSCKPAAPTATTEPPPPGPGPGEAPAIPTVPEVTVRLFSGPAECNNWPPLSQSMGYWEDVGISLDPAPDGGQMDAQKHPPLLIAGSTDVVHTYVPFIIPSMPDPTNIQVFTLSHLFVGFEILGNPAGNYKSVDDFVAEGMDHPDAIRAAIEQMRGVEFTHPAAPSLAGFLAWVFNEELHGLAYEDTVAVALADDPASLAEAESGRAMFWFGSAPQLVTLVKQGWKPIVGAKDALVTARPSADSEELLMVGHCGLATTQEFADANHDTLLRMASVFYRTADLINNDPDTAAAGIVGPINEANGTDLSAEDIKVIFDTQALHPGFDDVAGWYRDSDSAAYDYYPIESQILLYENSEVFEKDQFKAEDLMMTHEIYEELAGLRDEAQSLLATSKSSLDSLKAAGADVATLEMLIQQAEAFLAAYDFLDAKIFAEAAAEWAAYLEG